MKYLQGPILIVVFFSLMGCSTTKSENNEASVVETSKPVEKPDFYEALQGAWTTSYTNEEGEEVTVSAILTDGYMAQTFYNEQARRFDYTLGGSWTVEGNTFNLSCEFHSGDTTKVGQTESLVFDLKGDQVTVEGNDRIWNRIDDGKPGVLKGAYLITGRKRDGEISKRTPGSRKTMKILSGTRFQWIAYDTETTKFSGTGGGTYTAKDGEYIETIDFFSRDGSRVGAVLPFSFEIIDKEWHHSGLSSKGDPIYEIWTPRKMLDKASAQ